MPTVVKGDEGKVSFFLNVSIDVLSILEPGHRVQTETDFLIQEFGVKRSYLETLC